MPSFFGRYLVCFESVRGDAGGVGGLTSWFRGVFAGWPRDNYADPGHGRHNSASRVRLEMRENGVIGELEALIRCGLRNAVHDDHVYRYFGGLELQAELLG